MLINLKIIHSIKVVCLTSMNYSAISGHRKQMNAI